MMNVTKMLLVGVVALATVAGGCTKKVQITVFNHTDVAKNITLGTPDEGTQTIGAVGAGGQARSMLAVKTSDLPAQCSITAEGGATLSFMVTEDSPAKWFFHITKEGKMTGPYDKESVHVESEKTIDVSTPVQRRTILK